MKAWLLIVIVIVALPCLLSCSVAPPAPVLKVALLAPFEGARREQGYHLLPYLGAVTPDLVRGQKVEWVILDTGGDPELAVQRAREVLVDPAVLAIVGPLLPDEAFAVSPLVAEAGIAWWPLAPVGEEGLRAWLGDNRLPVTTEGMWGAEVWPSIRRGAVSSYWDPLVPWRDGDVPEGNEPWPQEWIFRESARLAFGAIEDAGMLNREEVRRVAAPLMMPEAARFVTSNGDYPGVPAPSDGGEP